MIPLAAFALTACLGVGAASDRIFAGDLAAAFPEWATVPPETPLALAPAPGVQRVFRLPELRRLAQFWNVVPLPEQEFCITRPVQVSTSSRLLAAMQRELPAARIEILDFSRQPAPDGELVFPSAGLRQGPDGGYWNGYVKYAGNRHFALWARVRVLSAVTHVIAVVDLKPGLIVDAAQVRSETREEIPSPGFTATIEEIAGKVLRRSVTAGAALRSEWLEPPKAVLRGETVQVEAINGAAHLKLEGMAEASGVIGEIISIWNPDSKHRFPARIEAKGKVLVTKGSL
jgi:flagella basal body P-ring formation protein FlgA